MKTDAAPIFHDQTEAVRHVSLCRASRVVLASGCFDPLRAGHVRDLEAARGHGDYLLVALHDDESVRELRGGGPVMADADRARVLSGLGAVDAVLVFHGTDASELIEAMRPVCEAMYVAYREGDTR